MANPKIKVKRSSVAGKVPAPNQLDRGELAVNSYDGKVYIVRDQFSVGIATTTHTLNPWDEYTIGSKIAYAGIASAQQFDGNITGSVNSSGVSTFSSNVKFDGSLGVGIDNPSQKIHIDGGNLLISNSTQSGSSAPQIRLNSSSSDGSSTRFMLGLATGNNHFINGAASNDTCISSPSNMLFGVGSTRKFRIKTTDVLTDVDLIPSGDNQTSLGRSNAKWSDLFTVNATFSGVVNANHGVTGNINSAGISTISGFTFPSTDGSEDQALVTDGNGSLSFKTLSGGGGGATGAGTTISTGVTTATQGQTSFTAPNVFDDGEQATAFSTQVFLNGVKQRLGASNDYQLSAPQTVTFTSGVDAGDDVTIVVYFGHTLEEEFFTATQGQKDFTLEGSLAAAKNYKVYLNGVRLRNTVDYSASAAVVLNQPAREGEQVDIVSDQAEDRLTAVENQTSFAPSDSNTTSDNMQVYMNGILLRETEDWTIGSPSVTILDADGLTAGDHLDVVVRRS